jgi:hypothetical protein
MSNTKLLLRCCMRLREAWENAPHRRGSPFWDAMARVDQWHRAFIEARTRLVKARQFGLTAILPGLERVAVMYLAKFPSVADPIATEPADPISTFSLRWFLAELQQIDADLGDVHIDLKAKLISATTEPITLEEVPLGSFEVCLRWEDAARSPSYDCFDIVAVDPNPSSADEDVTHPHVKRKKLCAGDAAVPIKRALEQGRLADAFSLVNGVLTTYNSESPHIRLSDWNGRNCSDCGDSVPSDDAHYCEGCSSDVCADCSSSCSACENTRCLSCLEACAVCHRSCCTNCLIPPTKAIDRSCCPKCIRKCPTCSGLFSKDEAIPASPLCPGCRSGKTAAVTSATTFATNRSDPLATDEELNHATSLEPDSAPLPA